MRVIKFFQTGLKVFNKLNGNVHSQICPANENPEFMKILKNDPDYITADGIGIVKAAKMLKQPLPGLSGVTVIVPCLKST